MAIAAGQPRPRIWVVPDPDPNAFATGRDPQHASIAVTEGLLARLNREELQGVVAHEMAHIANWDTRLMTLLAAMLGAIALMSDGLGRMMRGGVRVGSGGIARRRQGEGQPAWTGPAGALGLHPPHRAGRVPAARHGREPEAGVPRGRQRRRSSPGTRWPSRQRWKSSRMSRHRPAPSRRARRISASWIRRSGRCRSGRDCWGMSLRRIRRCGSAWPGSGEWPIRRELSSARHRHPSRRGTSGPPGASPRRRARRAPARPRRC